MFELLWRKTTALLFGTTGRAGIAIARKQFQLVVHKFCSADLKGVLRLQLVRGGILS